MFRISMRAHQLNYEHLVPKERRDDFDRRYALTSENEARYMQAFTPRFTHKDWNILVAEMDGKVVGYTLSKRESAHLLNKKGLFVDPEYQGVGIGKALFEASVASFPEGAIELQVIEGNDRARHIYESFGFTAKGYAERSFFGAPKVVMTLRKR